MTSPNQQDVAALVASGSDYADSLKQQAHWIAGTVNGTAKPSLRIDLGDLDHEELVAASEHMRKIVTALLASEARATALEGERARLDTAYEALKGVARSHLRSLLASEAQLARAREDAARYLRCMDRRGERLIELQIKSAKAREDAIAECIAVVERVGNWGDYKRDELTKDFGQPRFDLWTELVEALRSIPAPADGRGDQDTSNDWYSSVQIEEIKRS